MAEFKEAADIVCAIYNHMSMYVTLFQNLFKET